ncbi:hypothetical protein SDC9_86813 [bioreactor metagenome]|uniref:Uncharacterized protein n=1 Tax=bioreactor metagenome TaxID=1076179 RepID=A0A644ZNA0_9ZZZZ
MSILRSPGFSSNSTSEASGSTATVTVEVWMRPPDSVSGTRWTRWTPLSNLSREYAPAPSIIKEISLTPPSSVSFKFAISTFQPFVSAYMEYMRVREPAKSAASSPPTPALISMMTFFSSLGSFGSRRILSSPSRRSISSLAESYSSWAISRKPGSCIRFFAPSRSCSRFR